MKNKTIAAAVIGGVFAILAAIVSTFITQYETEDKAPSPNEPTEILMIDSSFTPSGWMGDGQKGEEFLSFSRISEEVQGSKRTVIKISYKPGPQKWAGVYWLFPENNWGNEKGKDLSGSRSIVFYTKGENGGEIVEFKSGGVRGTYGDTYQSSTGKISLNKEWEEQKIDLEGLDLSNVVGAFSWNAAISDNQNRELTFYLADIRITK